MTKVLLTVLLGIWINGAQGSPSDAFETVKLPGGDFNLVPSEIHSLALDKRWRHIKKVFVTAEAFGTDATVQILANGEVMGTLYIPAKDPNYVVTVGESVGSLEFQHVSGGRVRIRSVVATQSVRFTEGLALAPVPLPLIQAPSRNVGSWFAQKIIHLSDRLMPHLNLKTEAVPYLLPIKVAAGRTFAITKVEGDLSAKSVKALQILLKQIDFAEPLIEHLLQQPVTFDLAVELLALSQAIQETLD